MPFCPNCGSPVQPQQRFCNQCGKPLQAAPMAPPPPPPPVPAARQGRPLSKTRIQGYNKLNAWIKGSYGNWFADTRTSDQVKARLEQVLADMDKRGVFRGNPDARRGFQAYIESRMYGDLVKV